MKHIDKKPEIIKDINTDYSVDKYFDKVGLVGYKDQVKNYLDKKFSEVGVDNEGLKNTVEKSVHHSMEHIHDHLNHIEHDLSHIHHDIKETEQHIHHDIHHGSHEIMKHMDAHFDVTAIKFEDLNQQIANLSRN